MKRIQTTLIKVLMLGLMLQGALILLYLYRVDPFAGAIEGFLEAIPDEPAAESERQLLGIIGAWIMVALGVGGLVPVPQWRRNRAVTFSSGHGNITIQLDSVYRTMHRIISKMPEVRSCKLDIHPSPDGERVCIKAEARLFKLPQQRARETAVRVSDYIVDTVMNFLGLEDLMAVELNIQDFTVDVEESCEALMAAHGQEVETPPAVPEEEPPEPAVMPETAEPAEDPGSPPPVLKADEPPPVDVEDGAMSTEPELPETAPPEIPPVEEEEPAKAAATGPLLPDEEPAGVPDEMPSEQEAPLKPGTAAGLPPLAVDAAADEDAPEALESEGEDGPDPESGGNGSDDNNKDPWSL